MRASSAALGWLPDRRRWIVPLEQPGQQAVESAMPAKRTRRRSLADDAPVILVATARTPKWIKPQLTRLVDEAPTGKEWLHELKYDGYRMHARLDGRSASLLTRTGLDWSHRYQRTIEALKSLPVKAAYLDGELCAVNTDGVPVFSGCRPRWMKVGRMTLSFSPSIFCS